MHAEKEKECVLESQRSDHRSSNHSRVVDSIAFCHVPDLKIQLSVKTYVLMCVVVGF